MLRPESSFSVAIGGSSKLIVQIEVASIFMLGNF